MSVHSRQVGTAVDAGLGAVFAATLAFWAYRIAVSWGGLFWLFDCAAGAAVCVLALLRRRQRAWAAIAGLTVAAAAVLVAWLARLPAEPGPAMALGLSVLVGSAVRALKPLPAGAVAAAGLAIVAAGLLAFQRSSFSELPAVTTLNGAAWCAAIAVGLGLRLRDAQRRAVVEKVRRDERLALARELHDVVAHHITGIVLQTQAARIIRRKAPERLDDSLTDIEAAGSAALAAMRRIVGLLRDADDAAPATGPERLSELVDRFARHGPAVRLEVAGAEPDWPPEVASTVYRIVQESLTNVSRHAAHARSVTVNVTHDERSVTVEVADDGRPAPARYAARGGYGLIGIRERIQALDGTLTVGPRPEGGWSVLATLPVPARTRR